MTDKQKLMAIGMWIGMRSVVGGLSIAIAYLLLKLGIYAVRFV